MRGSQCQVENIFEVGVKGEAVETEGERNQLSTFDEGRR